MANPEHIEWLAEGVAAWNLRRKASDFTPDFTGADLASMNSLADPSSGIDRINLANVNFSRAILYKANLSWVGLSGANLEAADLRMATFAATDLKNTNLKAANVSTPNITDFKTSPKHISPVKQPLNPGTIKIDAPSEWRYLGMMDPRNDNNVTLPLNAITTLTSVLGLTQNQLNQMLGDSRTAIPERLTRPKHWPIWDSGIAENRVEDDSEDERARPLRRTLQPVTPIADVKWTAAGKITAKLRAAKPRAHQPVPTPAPDAVDQMVAGMIALSKQLRIQIENSQSPNAAPFIGDASRFFAALELELDKPAENILPVLIKANVAALTALGPNAEALADTDAALFTVFLEEAEKLLNLFPVLRIIETPYHEDIIQDDLVEDAKAHLADLDDRLNSKEVTAVIGPELGGVSRAADGYPWANDKQRIANKAAFWLAIVDKLENPPKLIGGTAAYVGIAGVLIPLIYSLLTLLFP